MALKITPHPEGICFAIKVVPGASRDRIAALLGDALKVTVSKPPERGAANQAILRLLADVLDVPASTASIVAGHSAARKIVLVRGITPQRLAEAVGIEVETLTGS